MNDWWKVPVLQGPENDYGEYDYLINELPKNKNEWRCYGKYKFRCDCCGKDHHILHVEESFFYTLDGYDSIAQHECVFCALKSYFRSLRYRIKRKIKNLKKHIKYAHLCRKAGLKYKDIFLV